MRADVPPTPLSVTVRQHALEDRVEGEPVGIECPTACGALFDTGSQVQLAAAPADGSRFLGWTGACTGRGACTVTLDAAKAVEAQFGPGEFRLALAVTGRGRVSATAARLSCTRRCSAAVAADVLVRVRAVATKGWRFLRWSGACRGRGVCSVRLSQNRAVGVVFQRLPKRG
jgi:hypothetical protein